MPLAAAYLSRRWRRQPSGLAAPNTDVVRRPVVMWDARSAVDLASPGTRLTRVGAVRATSKGAAFRTTQGTAGNRLDTGGRLPTTSKYKLQAPFTFVAYFIKRSSSGSTNSIGGCTGGNGTDGFFLGEQYGANYIYWQVGTASAGGTHTYPLDTPVLMVGTYDGTNVRVYRDGTPVGSTTVGSLSYDASFSSMFWGGNVDKTPSCTTDLYYVALDATAWPEAKIREVAEMPWSVFRPERTPVFYSAGGGGSIYDVSISESVSASDSLSAAAAFGGALAEAVSAADALAAVATLAGDLSEAASASDVVSAAAAYAGALSEAASASDAVSSTAQMAAALSESVSASDSIDGSIGAATYAAELVESVSASDSMTAAAVYASAIVEAVTAEDAITAGAVMAAVLSEVASADDSVGASLVIAAAIAEAVSAVDGWSGSVGSQVFEVELSEAVSASDAWVALGVLARHGVRGASALQRQTYGRTAQIQRGRRLN